MTSFVAIGRLLNGTTAWPAVFVYRARLVIVLLAVALPLTSASHARAALPMPGSVSVFPSDLLVLAAVLLWIAERVFARVPAARSASPLLGWPLLLFSAALIPGIIRGHERYGLSLVGQPIRLVLYASIALAVLQLRPRDLYWGLVAVLYAGVAWQLALAGYSELTGAHLSGAYLLSTGGERVISLGAGMYLASAFLIALLNIEFDRGRRRWLHLGAAGVALLAEALTFGRSTFVALALLIPVLFLTLRETRSFVLRRWPVLAAFAVVAIVAGAVTPAIGPTFIDRVTANPLEDTTVRWRIGSFEAALSGFRSGEWRQARTPDGVNHLNDSTFEHGILDWHIQGGTMETVRTNFPTFDDRALRFETEGSSFDEGPYSKPVLTDLGQTWKFTVWLRGAQGGELVNVGIWEYGTDGTHTGYANLPVVLTDQLAPHTIQVTVRSPQTTYVRAIVRTRSDPQKATVYADQASLTSVPGPAMVGSPENALQNSGFESGTTSWSMQGGTVVATPASNAMFGQLSARMRTAGAVVDEGLYSSPVPAHPGEDWTFSVWLKGALGHEVVAVELWEYKANGESSQHTVAPFELSNTLQRYYVRARIVKSDTTMIRALVRTWDYPSAVDVIVDQASLREAGPTTLAAPAVGNEYPGVLEPLLGVGFGRTFNYIWNGYAYHLEGDPHNSYIWILAGSGVFALVSLLLLMAVFLWDAIKRVRAAISFERALVLWAIGTWFIFFLNALTGPILSEPRFLLTIWIVILLPAIVPISRARREFH